MSGREKVSYHPPTWVEIDGWKRGQSLFLPQRERLVIGALEVAAFPRPAACHVDPLANDHEDAPIVPGRNGGDLSKEEPAGEGYGRLPRYSDESRYQCQGEGKSERRAKKHHRYFADWEIET
jgi:hypothetical protein